MKKEIKQQDEDAVDHNSIASQLQLFAMTKQALIKKVRILTHELAVFYRASKLQNQHTDINNDQVNQFNKQITEKDLIIEKQSHNLQILKSAYDKIQIQYSQLQIKITQRDTHIQKLVREIQVYKNKNQQYQKQGTKIKINKLQAQIKNSKIQMQSLIMDNKKKTKLCQQLTNKVAILQNLNSETEKKLVDALITKTCPLSKVTQADQYSNKQNKEQNARQPKLMIQIYSLKQTIKCLRQNLRVSQESKQKLRNKIQEREGFYSKMIALKK